MARAETCHRLSRRTLWIFINAALALARFIFGNAAKTSTSGAFGVRRHFAARRFGVAQGLSIGALFGSPLLLLLFALALGLIADSESRIKNRKFSIGGTRASAGANAKQQPSTFAHDGLAFDRERAPVAQLDRVLDFGSRCCRFKSCRVRHSITRNAWAGLIPEWARQAVIVTVIAHLIALVFGFVKRDREVYDYESDYGITVKITIETGTETRPSPS